MKNLRVLVSIISISVGAACGMGCAAKSKSSPIVSSPEATKTSDALAAAGNGPISSAMNFEDSAPVQIESITIAAGEVLVCGDLSQNRLNGLPLSIEINKIAKGKIEIVYLTQKDEVQSYTYEGRAHKDVPYKLVNDRRRSVTLDLDLYERKQNQPKSLWAQGSIAGKGLEDVAFTLECAVKKDEDSESRD